VRSLLDGVFPSHNAKIDPAKVKELIEKGDLKAVLPARCVVL